MTAEAIVALVTLQEAMLRTQRHNPVIQIRMHPLDVELCRRRYTPGSSKDWSQAVFALHGIVVIPDDAVGRGNPVAEYADE